MDSLVLELQRDVLDRTIHIPDLLRKALLVSRKLKIKDIEEWLNDELNGYELRSVPDYRLLTGELKAFNPRQGWIPVDMGGELHASMCETPARDSVSQIIDLVERTEIGTVMVKFPADLNAAFRNLMRTDFQPALHVPVHKLVRILDVTKTKVLDFALDLEARGILGEGIRFTKAEEQLAQSITYNTINIEKMENSQLQQSSQGSGQRRG
ncbi:AbiTii domain-containing protein [Pseudomonas sp. XP1]